MSGNNGLFVGLLVSLALFGPTIWLSITAKPIGTGTARKPYRWGTWVALASAITSLTFLPSVLVSFSVGQPFIAIEYSLPIIGLVGTCILLLERRHIGVVMFFALHLFLIVLNLLGPERVGEFAISRAKAPAAGLFIYLTVNWAYFAKRWELFGPSIKRD